MTPLCCILTLCSAASATAAPADRYQSAALSERQTFRSLPFRFGFGLGVRSGMQSSFVLSIGLQLKRWERAKLEGSLGILPASNLWIPGPFRTLVQIDNHYDLLFDLGPRLDVGPTLGISGRIYRQQWFDVARVPVPVAGLRVSAPLILARRFSWALDVRGLVDLSPVDLALDDREIRRASPFQVQVTFRFNFGHGRLPEGAT